MLNLEAAVEMTHDFFAKITQTHALNTGWFLSAIFAIPSWFKSEKVTAEHAVLIGILLFVFFIDWLTGVSLAKQSKVQKRLSRHGNSALIRNFIIISICGVSVGLDFVFRTGSYIFAFFTISFIWQNFYSFLGNVAALGWGSWFPMRLYKFVKDEMDSKVAKYFPERNVNDDEQEEQKK